MFQGLTQGATVSIFYKNEPRRVVDGRVISVNTHMPAYNPQQPMAMMNGPVTDISVQVGNETIPFSGLPANGIVANFSDKGIFISTDKSAVLREVEAFSNASKQILESVPAHQKIVEDCDALLSMLNPEKRKDEEIASMRGELAELKQLLLSIRGTQNKEE